MANPNQPQGVLNRLVASIVWNSFPGLNITPSFLLPEGIDLSFEGQMTVPLPSMTGIVQSGEPYLLTRFQVHLIKAQAFSDSWKQQIENNTNLGDCTIRPDVPVGAGLGPYLIGNCSITSLDRLTFSGRDAGFVLSFTGAYQINSTLFN